jgi:hypothetical protein
VKLQFFSKTIDRRRAGKQINPFTYSITMKIISQFTSEIFLYELGVNNFLNLGI